MNWCSTALLPTLAGLVLGYVLLLRHRSQARRIEAPVIRRAAPR